jgi:hypothetical protein
MFRFSFHYFFWIIFKTLCPHDEGLVVHRHQFLEDLEIPDLIVGRRQQATQSLEAIPSKAIRKP